MRQLKISKQITNRESQSLDKYLQEIGKVDLITADEEVVLAKQIKEGDQIALENYQSKLAIRCIGGQAISKPRISR
jgi:DNA-directed RNA polymerase sigma subunit (sigma70/sigma32)